MSNEWVCVGAILAVLLYAGGVWLLRKVLPGPPPSSSQSDDCSFKKGL